MATKFRDTLYGVPASSTTQNVPRYVEDKVRNLWPASAKMTAMVAIGAASEKGEFVEQPGKISKKAVDNIRFECYSYTPLAVSVTVGSGLSGTTLTLTDTTELVPPYTLVNTRNGTTCRVDSRTSDTVVEITSFGTTAFSCSSGDVLLVMAPAYHAGSQDPVSMWKDEDNLYNLTQIVRFPVKITGTAKANTSYFGDYFERMHKVGFIEGKRKMEGTLLFSNRPSSGNTSTGGAVYSTAFSSTRGAWQWAGTNSAFDAGFSFTPDKFRTELPAWYASNTANTVGDQSPMVMFCGNKVAGIMQGWVNMVQRIDMGGGEIDLFGLKAKAYQTSTFKVNVMVHDLFNRGSYANQALLFNPEELFYAYLKGRDVKPNNNIQNPSVDGYIDEIMGEIGLGVRDGGASMMQLTNLYALN